MIDWFILAIFANLLFGAQSFLYKFSNKQNFNEFRLIFSFTFTTAMISLVAAFISGTISSLSLVLFFGAVYGTFYFLKTVGQISALKRVPTNVVFPITSSYIAITVILALFVLNETLTALQSVGVGLTFFVIVTFYWKGRGSIEISKYKKGLFIAIGAMLAAAIANFTNKIAAINVNLKLFITISYLICASLCAFYLKSNKKEIFEPEVFKLGGVMGTINFIGWYSFLTALSVGPLSIIGPIVSLSFISASILAYIKYREEITPLRIVLILLAVIAVILLRI